MAKKTTVRRLSSKRLAQKPIQRRLDSKKNLLPVVGVGASAGGLEAFTQLLENLPASTGMAFVLIQHLDPNHESQLTEILSRKSKIPVHEIYGATPLAADNVYVIPASKNLRIEKG